ncbi:MAG TPA: amidohydrolase, partial [Cytophagales bacterium]|nr:amidohydrolase [Cytophagales bacterium]
EGRLDNPVALRQMIDLHDPAMFQELAEAMVEHETWFCPTHITRKMDAYADNHAYRHDERLHYLPRSLRRAWGRDADGMIERDPSPEGRQTYMDFYEKGLELTGKAHAMGVKVLAGTDANDSFCYPGFSIHDELQELVKAGLTPAEALLAATRLPAEFFGKTEDYGTLAVGKVGDVLLLEANPLEDIRNTETLTTVIQAGRVYTQKDLQRLLTYVKKQGRSPWLSVKAAWLSRG